MSQSDPEVMESHPRCRVCGEQAGFFDEATVLRKYAVRYDRCATCGFIQTESPYWLEEAYSSAIAMQDVGIMGRNLVNRELTTAVLNLLLPEVQRCVDYGAGHGVFVRLMRDRGFDFRWYDRHASNDYARGFEYEPGQHCDLITSFEVLEHLTDPVADLAEMMNLSDNLFVSTLPVPTPTPKVSDWWYFMPSSGQHISFYTPESLQYLANRFQRHLLSRGGYHLFTRKPRSAAIFRVATSFRFSRVANLFFRRPGLLEADFQKMLG